MPGKQPGCPPRESRKVLFGFQPYFLTLSSPHLCFLSQLLWVLHVMTFFLRDWIKSSKLKSKLPIMAYKACSCYTASYALLTYSSSCTPTTCSFPSTPASFMPLCLCLYFCLNLYGGLRRPCEPKLPHLQNEGNKNNLTGRDKQFLSSLEVLRQGILRCWEAQRKGANPTRALTNHFPGRWRLPAPSDELLGRFYIFAILNYAAMNILMPISLGTYSNIFP